MCGRGLVIWRYSHSAQLSWGSGLGWAWHNVWLGLGWSFIWSFDNIVPSLTHWCLLQRIAYKSGLICSWIYDCKCYYVFILYGNIPYYITRQYASRNIINSQTSTNQFPYRLQSIPKPAEINSHIGRDQFPHQLKSIPKPAEINSHTSSKEYSYRQISGFGRIF